MRVHVTHTIGKLRRGCESIATSAPAKLSRVVRTNTNQGTRTAQRIARAASGIHGENYWKRISGEMVGPLTGEFGPTGDVAGNAVGAGWRHGAGNHDLEKALDIQGTKFASSVGKVVDGLYWP